MIFAVPTQVTHYLIALKIRKQPIDWKILRKRLQVQISIRIILNQYNTTSCITGIPSKLSKAFW